MATILESIGWPIVTLLFAVFFVLIFRKPLLSLISRITSIDRNGIKASQTPEAQREVQKKESIQKFLLSIGDSIVTQDLESRIMADLNEKGLEAESETPKIVIKWLAATMLLLEFEQIHNLIFGSQIHLLKKLNEVTGQGRSRDFVEAHFERAKELFADQLGKWTLDQYLYLLFSRLLITTKGDVFHITNMGVEYLTWIVRNGRREDNQL